MNSSERLRLPFFRHPWPYPSAVCLLSNIARLRVLERQQLAALWLTGPSAKQFANQLDGMRYWVTDERIGVSLRLTALEVRLAFDPTHWWPEALRALATPFADPLRFCPACLEQGYHTHLFQLPWWQQCPVHDLDLISECPSCGGSLAGLGLRARPKFALHCSHCDRDFVNTGALVDAARSLIVERWHTVVGAHRRWASAVSKAFVVAPTLVTPYCEIAAQSVIEWIQASGVPWPIEIRQFVSELSTRPGGLRVRLPAPKEEDVEALERLSATIAHSTILDVNDLQVFPAIDRILGKSLARTERRLQWINSPAHRFRQRQKLNNDSQVCALKEVEESEAAMMRDRGYRLRCAEFALTEDHSLAMIGRRGDHLLGLAAFRLLCHVRSALADFESTAVPSTTKDVLEWWCAHLMTMVLIDGTAAAIHLVAFPVNGTTQLPGWPPVDLSRHLPGHAWVLAATRGKEGLVAHLESVPLASTMRPDTERACELQRNVGSRLLTFQKFSDKPAADRIR